MSGISQNYKKDPNPTTFESLFGTFTSFAISEGQSRARIPANIPQRAEVTRQIRVDLSAAKAGSLAARAFLTLHPQSRPPVMRPQPQVPEYTRQLRQVVQQQLMQPKATAAPVHQAQVSESTISQLKQTAQQAEIVASEAESEANEIEEEAESARENLAQVRRTYNRDDKALTHAWSYHPEEVGMELQRRYLETRDHLNRCVQEVATITKKAADASKKATQAREAQKRAQQALDAVAPPQPPSSAIDRFSRGLVKTFQARDNHGHLVFSSQTREDGVTIDRDYAQSVTSLSRPPQPPQIEKPKRYVSTRSPGSTAAPAWEKLYNFTQKRWIDTTEQRKLSEQYELVLI